MVYGPERKPIDVYPDKNERTKEIFSRVFTWITLFKQSDVYSNWDNGVSYLIMFEDDYFKQHKWIRVDGKPHWAYGSKYLMISTDRSEIYWTPNTITSKVEIAGDSATVTLESITPFFSSYQMREDPDGKWRDVPASVVVNLENHRTELTFRTINLQRVTGAEHAITIER